jgi:hypothetical protein
MREINRPREGVGTGTKLVVFVATACPAATAVTKPVEAITEILASNIASPVET